MQPCTRTHTAPLAPLTSLPSPRTLQQRYAQGPMVALCGVGGFFVSEVPLYPTDPTRRGLLSVVLGCLQTKSTQRTKVVPTIQEKPYRNEAALE